MTIGACRPFGRDDGLDTLPPIGNDDEKDVDPYDWDDVGCHSVLHVDGVVAFVTGVAVVVDSVLNDGHADDYQTLWAETNKNHENY